MKIGELGYLACIGAFCASILTGCSSNLFKKRGDIKQTENFEYVEKDTIKYFLKEFSGSLDRRLDKENLEYGSLNEYILTYDLYDRDLWVEFDKGELEENARKDFLKIAKKAAKDAAEETIEGTPLGDLISCFPKKLSLNVDGEKEDVGIGLNEEETDISAGVELNTSHFKISPCVYLEIDQGYKILYDPLDEELKQEFEYKNFKFKLKVKDLNELEEIKFGLEWRIRNNMLLEFDYKLDRENDETGIWVELVIKL